VTEPVSTATTRAASRPHVRHGFFAVGLLSVAGLRLADGAVFWAALLGVAGLVEVGLAVAGLVSGRAAGRAAGRTGAPSKPDTSAEPRTVDAGLPEPTVVERSLAGRRRNQRVWLFGVCVCTVAAVSLLPSEPALATVLAVLALVSLHRVRRERRSVAALHRLAATARSGRPTTEGSA
jgi:hypothetical protein